jgi:hypothetical protein
MFLRVFYSNSSSKVGIRLLSLIFDLDQQEKNVAINPIF